MENAKYEIKKPVAIAIAATALILIIALTASIILVCTLNTSGDKIFALKTFDVSSATITAKSADGTEKTVELTTEETVALVNVLNASALQLTIAKDYTPVYKVTLTSESGKKTDFSASGEYLSFNGKTYKTNGAVCNFLGYSVYGNL